MCLDDLRYALEDDLDEQLKIVEGQKIYIEILEEENKLQRAKIKMLEEKLKEAERQRPVWERDCRW